MPTMFRNAKFECKRPCCAAELISKSSTSSSSNATNILTTSSTTTAAAAAAAAGCSSNVRHHRRVVCNQPVGPVRCRSSPGLTYCCIRSQNNQICLDQTDLLEEIDPVWWKKRVRSCDSCVYVLDVVIYVTRFVGVPCKNLSMKSDFSQTHTSRSGFDFEREAFRAQLILNEFKQIGFNWLIGSDVSIVSFWTHPLSLTLTPWLLTVSRTSL